MEVIKRKVLRCENCLHDSVTKTAYNAADGKCQECRTPWTGDNWSTIMRPKGCLSVTEGHASDDVGRCERCLGLVLHLAGSTKLPGIPKIPNPRRKLWECVDCGHDRLYFSWVRYNSKPLKSSATIANVPEGTLCVTTGHGYDQAGLVCGRCLAGMRYPKEGGIKFPECVECGWDMPYKNEQTKIPTSFRPEGCLMVTAGQSVSETCSDFA